MQRVNAMYLRKIVALQEGDWERSQECRRQAELLALQSNVRQMFTLYHAELTQHARAGDLTGVRHLCLRIEALAREDRQAEPYVGLARGLFQQLRGDLAQAELELHGCLERCDPRVHGATAAVQAFCMAAAAYVEVLTERGAYEQARAWGSSALATLYDLEIDDGAWELERALALAEAKLPDMTEVATQRIMRSIVAQTELGIQGLRLGASYEARTRLAIWAGDGPAAVHYARLTAHEYRYGAGSVLGARYQKLREEARLAGIDLLPELD
jgi:hypothetical protein